MELTEANKEQLSQFLFDPQGEMILISPLISYYDFESLDFFTVWGQIKNHILMSPAGELTPGDFINCKPKLAPGPQGIYSSVPSMKPEQWKLTVSLPLE